ncbi:MAG: hypothetical protein QOD06_1749 [Candidatus Binatota bacterium]|jgi:hypothetical protein|nr:hypothetical protein [Candidatus Binatota bacterium]
MRLRLTICAVLAVAIPAVAVADTAAFERTAISATAVRVRGGLLTAHVDAPLDQVLGAIRRASGLEILVYGAAGQPVKLSCRDVALDEALRRLLRSRSFAFVYSRADGETAKLVAVHVYGAGPAIPPEAPPELVGGGDDVEPDRVLLDAESSAARIEAASALGRTWSEEAVSPLSWSVLRDEDPDVREAAAVALGKTWDASAVAPLSDALSSDSRAEVRMAAAAALSKTWSDAAIPPLTTAAESDGDPRVRAKAAAALRSIRGDP